MTRFRDLIPLSVSANYSLTYCTLLGRSVEGGALKIQDMLYVVPSHHPQHHKYFNQVLFQFSQEIVAAIHISFSRNQVRHLMQMAYDLYHLNLENCWTDTNLTYRKSQQ